MKITHPHKLFFPAALIMGCFFISCENADRVIKEQTARRIGVEEAKEIIINYSIGGKTKARLTAPYMLRYQDTTAYVEFPRTVHADFYTDSLQIESKLDAHYGRYMETENKVFLRDSVRVFNVNGDTLYCKQLYWDRSKKGSEFYTNDSVWIRTKTQIITGIGLDAPQDFKNWHIVNPTGFVKVPSSEFPQ